MRVTIRERGGIDGLFRWVEVQAGNAPKRPGKRRPGDDGEEEGAYRKATLAALGDGAPIGAEESHKWAVELHLVGRTPNRACHRRATAPSLQPAGSPAATALIRPLLVVVGERGGIWRLLRQ